MCEQADLVLLLEDMAAPVAVGAAATIDAAVLKIGSKADLGERVDRSRGGRYDLVVSAKSGAGVDELLTMIARAGRSGDR